LRISLKSSALTERYFEEDTSKVLHDRNAGLMKSKTTKQKNGRGKKTVKVDIRYRNWRFKVVAPERIVTKILWVLGFIVCVMLRYPELGQVLRHLWPM
jgi:hypothetical protein